MRHLGERLALGLALAACGLAGCRSLGLPSRPGNSSSLQLCNYSSLEAANREMARAESLESDGNEACVDAYLSACSLGWQSLGEHLPHVQPASAGSCYNAAVAGLLRSAQRFGRHDPTRGLVICTGDGTVQVKVVQHGFPWTASDFDRLHPPPTSEDSLLKRRYRCHGVGAPVVVERCRNDGDPLEARFMPERSFFAATAVLRFDCEAATGPSAAVLEFYNPLQNGGVASDSGELPLARDLTAPLAKTLEVAPRSYFAGFVEPGGSATAARLNFLEPYQPGKVPIILVHGLFSDPLSWTSLVNDLRAVPGFNQRFQLWVFRYPTGQGFLQSAAMLRAELRAAIDQVDPSHSDQAIQRIVLIGHSMGGLIAKLQVTFSDELVWNRLADRPLEEIVTTEATRARLAEICYFDPTPEVARVIFIASPQCGSLCSSACVGQAASLLIEPSAEQEAMHAQLIRDNPDTFNPRVERRFPTSIDMLTANSPLLDAMREMRLRSGVKLHNIIGVSHPISLDGPSDGVVSVYSAKHPWAQSTRTIAASHAKVHQELQTSLEILCILNRHWPGTAQRDGVHSVEGTIPEIYVDGAVPLAH